MSVDLPAPFAPTSPMMPGSTSTVSASSAVRRRIALRQRPRLDQRRHGATVRPSRPPRLRDDPDPSPDAGTGAGAGREPGRPTRRPSRETGACRRTTPAGLRCRGSAGRGGDRGVQLDRRPAGRCAPRPPAARPARSRAAVSSSGRADAPVRGAGRGAQGGQVDAVRRAEDPLERGGVLGRRPAPAAPKIAAAVVVDHHDREVRARGSPGPITRPFASCRNVRSPSSAYAGRRRAGERGAHGGRHRAVDAGQRRGWPARSRRSAAAARSRSRTGMDEPATSRPAGRARVQVERRGRPRRRTSQAGRRAAGPPRPRSRGRRRARPATPGRVGLSAAGRRPVAAPDRVDVGGRTVGSGQRPGGATTSTATPGPQQPATARCSVGAADDEHAVRPVRRGEARSAQQQVAAAAARSARHVRRRTARPTTGQPRASASAGRRRAQPARRRRRRRRTRVRGRPAGGPGVAVRPVVARRRPGRRGPDQAGPRRTVGRPVQRLAARCRRRPGRAARGAARFRCTGPGRWWRPGRRGDRPADQRAPVGDLPGPASGAPDLVEQPDRRRRTCATWSTVWLAPVPRSSGGRSAVSTTQRDAGVRAPPARPGAGWPPPCPTW